MAIILDNTVLQDSDLPLCSKIYSMSSLSASETCHVEKIYKNRKSTYLPV